jgi:hypothetical protein
MATEIPNTTKMNNLMVLANATEIATELAFQVIRKNPNLAPREGSNDNKSTRAELQRAFAAKLGAKITAAQGA